MSGNRNDTLERMRAANPASAAELREAIDDVDLSRAMRRAIVAGEDPSRPVPAGDRAALESARSIPGRGGSPSRRRTATFGLGAGVAAVAAVAAVLLFAGGSVGGGGRPAFAAAAIEVAEANPRLLVTAPGWAVTRADEFEADEGEMTFSDGSRRFDVRWYPARFYGGYLRDRAFVSTPVRSTLLGRTATTVDYGREEYATMLAPRGRVFVEVRGRLGSRADYEAVLGSLRPVSVETWLAAMPASVVGPEDRAAAVEEALRGVPLPPGFDRAALEEEGAVRDQYQFVAHVTGLVACGWVESWLAAKRTGNEKVAAEAVEAMSTWSSWPSLRGEEMERGWAENIRQAANRIEHGRLNHGPAGALVNPDGTGYELGPAWAVALNCTSHHWRRPLDP
jgi:hypothetical protein